MKTPKVNIINKPIFLEPKKDFIFDKVPVFFFPQHNTSVLGIEFIFEINSLVLKSNSSLALSSVNSFFTCGTKKMNEVEINNKIDSSGGYISKIYNRRHFEFSLHILSNSFSDVLPVFSDCIFNSIYPEDIIRNKLHPTDKTIQQIQSYLNSLQKYEKLSLRKAI